VKRLAVSLLSLALTACGGQAALAGGQPTATQSVSGTNGPFHAVAMPATLSAGGSVHLTLTVTGPLQYEVGCVQTLHIWAEDATHQVIWNEPQPIISCMALGYKSLAPGETATFKVDWPTARNLSPGTYTLNGLFLTVLPRGAGMRVRENLPPLAIQITG
jgi:hypothetical protein